MTIFNSNGDGQSRIWKWKKVDILFGVGIGIMLYGAYKLSVEVILGGLTVTGIPFFQRGDGK